MHSILKRQLKRLGMDEKSLPVGHTWKSVLDAIDRAYCGFDEDRYLIERSLEISSKEMQGLYHELKLSSENKFNAIFDSAVDGIITIDEYGTIDLANASVENIFGYSAGKMKGLDSKLLLPEKYHDAHGRYLAEYRETGVIKIIGQVLELKGQRKSGEVFPMNLSISEMKIKDQRMFSAILQDITVKKTMEKTLFSEKERAQVTLSSISDAVITTDKKGRIDYANPVALGLICHSLLMIQGKQLSDVVSLISDNDENIIGDPSVHCLSINETINISDVTLVRNDGKEISIEGNVATLKNQKNDTIGTVLVMRDISINRELTRTIKHQATHDSLTGLINRFEFESRVQKALDSARDNDEEHIMLFMDLDQFKVINDTCGHIAGDELLRQLTSQISSYIRKDDTLARLGGDEFGVLFKHCKKIRALDIADKIRKGVQDYHFSWRDNIFTLGISIGLVGINRYSTTMTDLFSLADTACYLAKEAGRNRIHAYDEHSDVVSQKQGEMRWISDINKAIEDDRLVLYYQDIVPVTGTGTLRHYEILIRYIDVNGNIIPPGAFLPAAERYNFSPLIDRWVINTMFNWLGSHHGHLETLEHCAINLSGNSLCDNDFRAFIEDQFKEFNIPTHNICFEITETSAITNLTEATRFISHFRDMGCEFALDDFGSGLSSYAYLKNLPVDYIKIDGTFVRDIVDDPIDRVMVESINKIGQVMGKKTIAEFVENDEILGVLRTIGVDYAQGYGISKPRPLDNLLAGYNEDTPLTYRLNKNK